MRVSIILLAGACAFIGCERSPAAPTAGDDVAATHTVGDGISMHAVVSFGRDDVGSPFPPPEHDASFHAKDRVRPRTVRIRAGGSVTFEMGTFHNVAIYDRGVKPEDIDVTATVDLTTPSGMVIIPDFLIEDAQDRLEVSPFSFAPRSWTSSTGTVTTPGTFDTPGTYLVICRVVPHFAISKMYAWVVVL